ncbi:MAG: conjugal transfer protein TraN [Pseudomonadota bacterium]
MKRILLPAVGICLSFCAAVTVFAQTPKEEAEDLALSLREGIQDGAKATPTPDSVPGFITDSPSETSYYGSPSSIGSDAGVAVTTEPTAQALTDSMALRPVIPPSDIATAAAPGLGTQAGAPSTLPDFTGTYGACTSSLIAGSVVATCADDTYCISGNCETASRDVNDELPDAASGLQMMKSLTSEFDETTLTVFGGGDYRCRTAFAGALNCCGDEGFISDIIGCPTEAQILNTKLGEDLCTYVGKYCSRRVLGVCLGKKRTYCCFESKLSRIVQTQGRAQIGKSFGSPESPDCGGFSIAEFQSLDFGAMDLSDYYADAVATVNPPSEADAIPGLEAQIRAHYP